MMVPAGDFATVQTLARNFGVRDVTVPGEFGFIQGSIHDTAILSAYACTKTWRPAFAQFFSGLFEDRGGVYIDIGANIGLTAIPVASNPEVACLSFEPDPENFRYLRNNVEQNCAHRNGSCSTSRSLTRLAVSISGCAIITGAIIGSAAVLQTEHSANSLATRSRCLHYRWTMCWRRAPWTAPDQLPSRS